MQFRRLTFALKFPCEDGGVVLIVAERLALGCLMLLAKMCAGRFVALQRVNAHQLGEFEKISDAPGAFQRLVIIFFVAGDAHVAPKFVAQFWNFLQRFAQSVFRCATFRICPREADRVRDGTNLASACR